MKRLFIPIMIIILVYLSFSNLSVEIKSEESIIEQCLSTLYNVPNANEFDEINTSIDLTQIKNKYQDLFSEKGFKKFMSDRLHFLYRSVAKNGQFSIELKNIDIKKIWINEGDGSVVNKYNKVGYEYQVELLIVYTESGKTDTLYEEGYINLVEIDGDWKVDLISYKVLNNLFMKNLYIKPDV